MVYGELGLTYYHVYYPGEIQVSDKPQKNIVGYDSHSVYTFADHKKKPMSGNAEMRNNMVVPTDVCADFAVSVRERKKRDISRIIVHLETKIILALKKSIIQYEANKHI